MNKIKKVVITTGGTGGHIFPALGLAKHFTEKKILVEITTDKRGLKYLDDIKDFTIIKIPSTTPLNKNPIKFFISPIIIFFALIKSLIYLIKSKPDLVFGMGGYSSFPVCLAAKILKKPFIIYENNMHIGRSNKYLLPLSEKIFVSFKDLEGISSKYNKKICLIGNIVRKEFLNFNNTTKTTNNDQKLKILILGGSQAAKIFGEQIPKIVEKCVASKIPIKIFQQCLPSQNKFLENTYKNLKIDFEIFNFSKNILHYFSKTDIAITRSGSSMLAELFNSNIPFISVPLPTSADNHQLKNAVYYEKNRYSYLVEEKDLNEKLFQLINQINDNRSILLEIMNRQRQFSDKLVYENIDFQINQWINEKY